MLWQHTKNTWLDLYQGFLTHPIGFTMTRRNRWELILTVNLFCPLFLIFFQPFGVNNYDPTQNIDPELVFAVCSFGLINALAMFISEFILRPFLLRNEITIIQLIAWIGWTLLLLSSTTYFHYNFLGGFHDWSFESYGGFLRDVSILMLFPVGGYYFFHHYRSVHEQVVYLQKIRTTEGLDDQMIWLESEAGNDKLGVKMDQLLYLEAQDNYVAVYHLEKEVVKKALLRTTLKNLEAHFAKLPLMRCHRSYIVNLKQIEKVKGNGRRLQLQVAKVYTPVPVSRSFSEAVMQQFRDVGTLQVAFSS